ncbi:MAG: HAD family hydrolase [DPANN group archaeon]|nr:HAD family hydrolase [DPANN group archaeon]
MGFNTFIFDLDGTLVHTRDEYRYDVVRKTLQDIGVEYNHELVDHVWFGTHRDILLKNAGINPDLFWNSFTNYDTVAFRKPFIELYNDISIINQLRKYGHTIGIVTGAPEEIALMELGLIGINKFDHIVIARDEHGINYKPDPHGINECIRLCGADKTKTMYVGNGSEDVIAAKAAGVLDILINRDEHDLDDVSPSVILNSLYELEQFM